MKKMQRLDFYREIRKTWSRYLSILFIVALGVAFFSGLRSSEPDMKLSVDTYMDESSFMDIRVLGTYGMTEKDIAAFKNIEGVRQAEGVYSGEALCMVDDQELVLSLTSLTGEVNQLYLLEGRLPQTADECFADYAFIRSSGYKLGDTVTIYGEEENDLEDVVSRNTYTIAGIGYSPFYLSWERGSASIGGGSVSAFLVIPEENFVQDVYSQAYVTLDEALALNCYSDEYEDIVAEAVTHIEAIADVQCEIRYGEIVGTYQDELDDARKELEDGREEADRELADAWKELQNAEAELADGKKELEEGEQELAEARLELEDGTKELEEKEAELVNARAEIESGWQQLNSSLGSLNSKESEYQASITLYNQKVEEFRQAIETLNETEDNLKAGRQMFEEALTTWQAHDSEWQAQNDQLNQSVDAAANQMLEAGLAESYEAAVAMAEATEEIAAGRAALASARAELDTAKAELDTQEQTLLEGEAAFNSAYEVLNAGQSELDSAFLQLQSARAQLDAGWSQYSTGYNTLTQSEVSLADGERQIAEARETLEEAEAEILDGEETLEEARQKIIDGELELEEGYEEYEQAKKDVEEELSEAEDEIADAEKDLEKISIPEWYVLDRSTIQDYVEFGQDADSIKALSGIFPLLFFFVAALVSLTTMTRMVEEQRVLIGTMKALGYSQASVTMRYVLYAFSASCFGSILGALAGGKLFPYVVISAYKMMFEALPVTLIPYQLEASLLAGGLAIAITTLATLAACISALSEMPARLMRPAAPKKGKRVLLEYLPFIWKHLNFSQKSTIRNLMRYKKRFFMTVFGIGGCMALLLVGYGLRDSISEIVSNQYKTIWYYDMAAALGSSADEEEKEEVSDYLEQQSQVTDTLNLRQETMDVTYTGVQKEAYLVIPESIEMFERFVDLRDRVTKETYELTADGVVISEKLAKLLDAEAGDVITLKTDDTHSCEVRVSAITEQYIYHYIYMLPELYEKTFGKEPKYNLIYLALPETNEDEQNLVARDLLNLEAVSSVSTTIALNRQVANMMKALDLVVWVLIIAAGLLAFVVLYNLNNINITERRRELATIKVLGFYDIETAQYVYRENIYLTLIGIVAGIIMGIFLHQYVILTVELDMLMFGREIMLKSFIYSIILTVLFSFVVNFAMYYKLKKIDMVESLKSVE